MRGTRIVPMLLIMTIATPALRAQATTTHAGHTPKSDSAFAQVQERGRAVMGVDQYTSTHVFESLPDGGRIVLQLWHVGRVSHVSLQPNGGAPVAPSAIAASPAAPTGTVMNQLTFGTMSRQPRPWGARALRKFSRQLKTIPLNTQE